LKVTINVKGTKYRGRAAALLGAFALAIASACADPAANKPKADVANPTSAPAAPANAETLAITPANTKIEFVGSNPKEAHQGSFKNFTGQLDFVTGKPESSRVTIDIDMTSVQTDADKLTEHLKSPDFFDVAKFPKATFVSTEIKGGGTNGASHTVTGNLELHGVKKAITFPATIAASGEGATLTSEFAINRKDFGIVYPGQANNLIRDDVVLKLNVNAQRGSGAQK
jgi:polyisoprenoid-binding protein YceI